MILLTFINVPFKSRNILRKPSLRHQSSIFLLLIKNLIFTRTTFQNKTITFLLNWNDCHSQQSPLSKKYIHLNERHHFVILFLNKTVPFPLDFEEILHQILFHRIYNLLKQVKLVKSENLFH